ncbi:MAG TPA: SDR family oxidoreductase [Dongiaceae bacterium]|nr:SDR family oxidoreductase [Dongiaceae bacterium]
MSAANPETVLITGASSGIGLELAKCFAADCCKLVLVARNIAALEKIAEELRRKNKIEAIVLPADLSLPETPKRIFRELSAQKISVDVLVNNAGFGLHDAFVKLPLQRQLEIIQVNVTALTELTGLFLPEMIQRKNGGILNVASVAGFLPGPNMAVYYASKAFVLSFSEALAEELGGTGVTVSAFCPGATESNFSQIARGEKSRKSKTTKMSAEQAARYGHRAFRNEQVVAIPGLQNHFLVFLTRILPRQTVRKAVHSFNKLDE